MAELLTDVDRLLTRFENLDQTLGQTIEKSTKDAASKGFLSASLQMKRVVEDLELKIEQLSSISHASNSNSVPVSAKPSWIIFNESFRPTFCFLIGLIGSLVGQFCWAELIKLF